MSCFNDNERVYLTEMRAITTDGAGNDILVGLTLEETTFYMNFARLSLARKEQRGDAEKYLKLHDKHEAARLQVLGAEMHLRNENPEIH